MESHLQSYRLRLQKHKRNGTRSTCCVCLQLGPFFMAFSIDSGDVVNRASAVICKIYNLSISLIALDSLDALVYISADWKKSP